MTNYMDPAVILANAAFFAKLLLVLLGFIGWETLTSLPFDYDVVMRKRAFKWPMGFYWLCKYSIFFAMIGLNIATNVTNRVNCQALYVFNQFAGNMAIGGASTVLMLRAIAIWSSNLYVVVPLGVLSLGQWGILLHGMTNISASWNETAKQCIPTDVPPVFIQLIFIYTMSLDFIVLVASSAGLLLAPGKTRTGLWNLLFTDGLIYFIIAVTANTVPVIMQVLNLNPVLNVVANVPAVCVTSVAACRAFVRLNTWTAKDVYVHSTHVHSTKYSSNRTAAGSKFGKGGASNGVTSEPFAVGGTQSMIPSSERLHIQMDTYVDAKDADNYSRPSVDVESQNDHHKNRAVSSFGPEM